MAILTSNRRVPWNSCPKALFFVPTDSVLSTFRMEMVREKSTFPDPAIFPAISEVFFSSPRS